MTDPDNEGKIEISVRILGNELVAMRMVVDDFKMKWLIVGVAAITVLAWGASHFAPLLAAAFGAG
jgi:hypothetical protein